MTNEEIRNNIFQQQSIIRASFGATNGKFETNPELLAAKKEIDRLKRLCTHTYPDGTVNDNGLGRCGFCGGKL